MSLTDEELERLADVVELQPTKNKELMERWGLDSGSDVHGYLEGHLSDYYYRDENSLIRATAEAADLVDVEPGVEAGEDGDPGVVRVPELEALVFEVLAGPTDRSESVVSVLHKLRDRYPDRLGADRSSDGETRTRPRPEPGLRADDDTTDAEEAGEDEADAEAEDEVTADDVRRALQNLRRKGVVEVVYRTVPTFRLAVDREDVTVERIE
jgi:hypothetical protein